MPELSGTASLVEMLLLDPQRVVVQQLSEVSPCRVHAQWRRDLLGD